MPVAREPRDASITDGTFFDVHSVEIGRAGAFHIIHSSIPVGNERPANEDRRHFTRIGVAVVKLVCPVVLWSNIWTASACERTTRVVLLLMTMRVIAPTAV